MQLAIHSSYRGVSDLPIHFTATSNEHACLGYESLPPCTRGIGKTARQRAVMRNPKQPTSTKRLGDSQNEGEYCQHDRCRNEGILQICAADAS